ncbi:MAG: biopolymer transporter ExbD [Phycisphaerales bacterium]|nr:biopolymer transporter ExbD [Phycisphaerales bacterium]MCB9864667.1 biopolymer transporter ExbD [Phycisphaerales bacterium]
MPDETPIRVNLAPVVDVTMSLLIFFLLTTRMVERESSTRIDLPVARSAQDTDRQDLGNRFVVNIRDARDEGGTGVEYVVDEKIMSLADVLNRLTEEKRHQPNVNCIIRGDRTLPFEYVQQVMVGCGRIGVTKVTFSAVPRGSGGESS